jgi:hypothetical protein
LGGLRAGGVTTGHGCGTASRRRGVTARPEAASRTSGKSAWRRSFMAEHKHGEMDIETQKKTFNGFIRMVMNAAIVIIVFLLFLALVNG